MYHFYKMALCIILVLAKSFACPSESDTSPYSSPIIPAPHAASTTADSLQGNTPSAARSIASCTTVNMFAHALNDADILSPHADSAEHALTYATHNIHHKPEPFITWLQDQLPKRIFTADEWEIFEQFEEIQTDAKAFRQNPNLFLSASGQQRASLYHRTSARLMNSMRDLSLHLQQAQFMPFASMMEQAEQKTKLIQRINFTNRLLTLTTLIFWDVFKATGTAEDKLQLYTMFTRSAYENQKKDHQFQHRLIATALLALTPIDFWKSATIQHLCIDYVKDHTQPSMARGKIAGLMHMKFFSACPQAIHPSWTKFSAQLLGTDYSATVSLTLSCCKAVIDAKVLQDIEPIRIFLNSVDVSKLSNHAAELFCALRTQLDVAQQMTPIILSTSSSLTDWVSSVLLP